MEPLKEPRLRTGKPRTVVRLENEDGKFRKNGQSLAGPPGANLIAIVEAIEKGDQIDPDLYREHKGRSDTLLMKLGIMHIHLTPGSNLLLFLRQFEDHVELIEVNDHGPFDPPGAVEYFEAKYRNILWNSQREFELKAKKGKSQLAASVANLTKNRRKPKTEEGGE